MLCGRGVLYVWVRSLVCEVGFVGFVVDWGEVVLFFVFGEEDCVFGCGCVEFFEF